MSSAAAAKEPDRSEKPRRALSPWLLALGGTLALLIIGTLIWVLPVGQRIVSGTDRRNQTDLAIATAGLEQWSGAVAGLARANFINGQAVPLAAGERDYADGWRYRTLLRHPTLDEFKITYAVTTADGCKAIIADIEGREGKLPFVTNYIDGNSGFLKIVDSFPLGQIRGDDQRGLAGSTDAARYLRTIDPGAAAPADKAVVCYSAGIPIDRLLAIDKAARGFSNLLIIDGRDRVAVQVGAEKLPVKSLAGMAPESSVLARTLAVSTGQPAPATPAPPRVADSLKPVDINIGGRSFIAYVRPLNPPASFRACLPPPTAVLPQTAVTTSGNAQTTVAVSPAAADGGDTAARPANACLVVALMPRATLWRQVIALPLADRVFIGIALVAFIALLPSLRLILLGPSEAIGRAEAIGVALGLPAMVSMATLAVLLAIDINAHRTAADARAGRIAAQASSAAEGQIRKAVAMLAPVAGPLPARFPPVITTLDAVSGPRTLPSPQQQPWQPPRPDLAADPVAMVWPANFCRNWAASGLPVIDSAGLIDDDGRQLAGTRTIACRQFLGGRSNVSARDYFQRLRNGDPSLTDGETADHRRYVIAQVSALQDGVSKAVIALRTQMPNTGRTFAEQQRTSVYVVGTATLTTVIAPVLPPGYNLMVVDTRDPTLPVLLHTTPGRSGAERLATLVRNPEDVRDRLRLLMMRANQAGPGPGQAPPLAGFRSYYDGADRQFVAAPIAGTPWVAMVTYSLADIDRESADSALHALRSWAAFSILFTLAWVAWLGWTGSRGWPRLWPQQALGDRYPGLARRFAVLAAAAAVLILLFGPAAPAAALLAGLAVRLTAAWWLHDDLGKGGPDPSAELLGPETEQRYTSMLIALIACLSVVPMLGFWREAHDHVAEEYRARSLAALVGPDGTLDANRRMLARLRWAYGLDPAGTQTPDRRDPGSYDLVIARTQPLAAADQPLADAFSDFFDFVIGRSDAAPSPGCPPLAKPDPARPGALQLCEARGATPRYGIALPPAAPGDWLNWGLAFIALGVAIAVLGFRWLLGRVLRGLAGFGVPLEAFRPPPLYVGDLFTRSTETQRPANAVTLNRKSLLVNAPYIVIPILRMGGVRLTSVNVADLQVNPPPLVEGNVMVVTGLELVLADRERRLRALHILEEQSHALAQLGIATRSRLVILSEAAPLERILNAYERDRSRTAVDTERENLRWSRLFEDFATFNFRQSRLTGSADQAGRIAAATSDARQRAILATACAELRWLPQRVAAGAIGTEVLLDDAVLQRAFIPIPDIDYQTVFEPRIISWASDRQFPGKEAVRAHIRNQCIEYYQKLWSSSTHAEHLVMHNLANARFVNIGTALAFVSLVRRGIIIFDPEPRLMNESFAMFVRQAEKLDTIRYWRSELPRGAWMIARLPIFALIGAVIAGLVTVAVLSGEDVVSLLPVLAAGIPALLAASQRLFGRV